MAKNKLPGVKLHNRYYLSLGDYFKYIRARSGLSQLQVTRRLGLKSGYQIFCWENNERIVPMHHIKKLARIYGVPNLEIRTMIVKFEIIKLKKMWGLYDG